MLSFSRLEILPRSAKMAILAVSDSLMAAVAVWVAVLLRAGACQYCLVVCCDCYRVGHVAGTDSCGRLRLLPLGIAVRYPDLNCEISLGERDFGLDIGWHRMGTAVLR